MKYLLSIDEVYMFLMSFMKFTFLLRFLKYKNNLCVLSLVNFLINNITINIKIVSHQL